jgi:sugar lactone lactonase YvrE
MSEKSGHFADGRLEVESKTYEELMTKILVPDLRFPEGLRWHAGQLWFSDFVLRKVFAMSANGCIEEQAHVPGQPSGLGFAPDGSTRVVSMLDRKLLRIDGGDLQVVAALDRLAVGPCNDMVMDVLGNAYIGCFGYECWYERPTLEAVGPLLWVGADGRSRVAARDLACANGMVLTDGGRRLVVAETLACRLTVFDVAADGGLSGRRVFADLDGGRPDGICADRDGNIWVACVTEEEFRLVREGGEVLDIRRTPGRWAVTCVLGGDDGLRLFMATAVVKNPHDFRRGSSVGAIEYEDVMAGAW